MVVSWTLKIHQAPTRVIIEGGGLQARASLNGGELGTEPVLGDKRFFFLLLAARVRSSCEEGPGQSALQSA